MKLMLLLNGLKSHKLHIGEQSAEKIKCSVGSAIRSEGEKIAVKGQDQITGDLKLLKFLQMKFDKH